MKYCFYIISCLLIFQSAAGQKDTVVNKNDSLPARFYLLQKVKRNGEALPEIEIKEVAIVGRMKGSPRKVQSQFRQYQRLVYNLKKTYPYAMIVRERLAEVNGELLTLTDEKDRKSYLRQFEKQVFREYEDDIRNMTITQGKLLLKLIYRETYYTSYDLIKEYRGGVNAAFWQGIARIFGTNLKSEYDPYGEDILIEFILQDIQAGLL